jgi:TolA-binding protein
MNRTILVALCAAIFANSASAAEPSAFGAGDLSNPTPYGLTSNEKVVLENKTKLQKVVVKSNNQANEVDSLRERIDGLQTIIESLSRKSQNNKINIQKISEKNRSKLETSDEYEKRVSEVTQKNTENIEKINLLMSELSTLVETINSTYVTRVEFNEFIKGINKSKGSSKSTATSFKKMSNAEIAKKAKSSFNKKYYTKSIEFYSYLIEKNYKPANAHYMIGEMKYRRKNYSEAIAYFKKSASLYAEASYMPTLMLHTAIAMQKSGDKKNAKAFFKGLIVKYPKSKEAQEAKKYL